jgi:hypothetical protein
MISTADRFDAEMVRQYIARHGLDPVVEDEPNAVKVGTVRVTIERYGWGRVFFAEDRGNALALTWVERGDKAPTLPPWARRVRALIDRPECLGYHESDHVCDGGENPDTGAPERPCAWRDRCLLIQRIAGKPESVAGVLAQFTDEDLARKIEEANPPKRTKPIDPARAKERERRSAATYTDSVSMVRGMVDRVMEIGGWTLARSRWRASAGQFFLRQYARGDRADYLVLFRRIATDDGDGRARMPSIVLMYPHRSAIRASLQIRTGQLEFVREVMPPELTPSLGRYDETHGAIVSVNRILSEHVEDVAHGLFRIIQERKFDAPGAWPAIGDGPPRAWTQWSVLRGKR